MHSTLLYSVSVKRGYKHLAVVVQRYDDDDVQKF